MVAWCLNGIQLAYPGRTITLTDTGKRIDANSLSISPVLDIQPGTKVELNGKASYILDQSGVSVNLDSEVRVAGMNSPIRYKRITGLIVIKLFIAFMVLQDDS